MNEEEKDKVPFNSSGSSSTPGIKAMEEELEALRKQLVRAEKLTSLGILSAGIAHEIKNPLNFITNFSELSLEYLEEAEEHMASIAPSESVAEARQLLDDVRANLDKIKQHGERISRIVTSMLLHSRGSDGHFELVNLNQLLKEFVNLAFHGMRAGKAPINVDIQLNLDENMPGVPLIIEDFSRVILNLCTNAFDALRSQRKHLGTPSSDSLQGSTTPLLKITSRYSDQEVSITIEDNGPGVAKEIRDRIFEPFFTTKKGMQGTGLGLSITRDIIENHKGSISMESEPGSFTRFIIKLPIQPR